MTVRLRQVALVARDLEPAIRELSDTLGIELGYRDPGIAEFGLVNAVFPVGDAFLEIVSPVRESTTAGRLLDKHGGDYGYMVIMQLSDLEAARTRLDSLGIRVVWKADLRDAAGTHLHPKDVGGTILSLDWMDPPTSWRWAGPDWEKHVRTDVVSGLTGVTVAVEDPGATAGRWAEVFGVAPVGAEIPLDNGTSISFVESPRREDDGVCGVTVTATDRDRAGETAEVCGITIRFA